MALRNYIVVFLIVLCVVLLTIVYLSQLTDYALLPNIRQSVETAAHSTVNHTGVSLVPVTATHSSTNRSGVQRMDFVDQRHSKSVTNLINQTNRSQGYLLARFYDQQMTAGILDFFKLSNIAFRLNLSTVIPFVQGSHLMGIPDITSKHGDHRFWNLSNLYDMDELQSALTTCSLHELVSFDAVLTKAPQNVVLVYLLTRDYNQFQKYFSGEKIVELDSKNAVHISQVKKTLSILNAYVNHFTKVHQKQLPLFYHPRVVLVDVRPFHPLLLSTLITKFGSIVFEEMNKYGISLMIFDTWRGTHNKDDSSFFYYVPDYNLNVPACGAYVLHHSMTVIEAARNLSTSLNQTRPVIGVHIRGERLLINTKGKFSDCFRQLTDLLETLTNTSKIPSERVHVFHDLGGYGTKSCTYGHCVKERSKLLSQINSLSYRVTSYEPTKFNSVPVSPAFASFVEREYLANVDILVTIGGGGFQHSIILRFLKNSGNNKDNVYNIC